MLAFEYSQSHVIKAKEFSNDSGTCYPAASLLNIYGFSKYKLKLNCVISIICGSSLFQQPPLLLVLKHGMRIYMKQIKYHRARCVHNKPGYVSIPTVYCQLYEWVALNVHAQIFGHIISRLRAKFLTVHLFFCDCYLNNV
jgi:hypothetical protein